MWFHIKYKVVTCIKVIMSRASYHATEEEVGEDLKGMALVWQEHYSFNILEESVANGAQNMLGDHLHYKCGGPVVCFSVGKHEGKLGIIVCHTTDITAVILLPILFSGQRKTFSKKIYTR